MKKRILLWVLPLLIILVAWNIVPNLIRQTIPSIYYVMPSSKVYENVVNCNGTIYSLNQSQIRLEHPVNTKKVFVEIGDYVQAGDVIAIVEPSAAINALSALPQSIQLDQEAIRSMVAAYGLGQILEQAGLGNGLNLEGLLADNKGLAQQEVTTLPAGQTKVVAPISGVVTQVGLQAGTVAHQGEAAATIMDTASYKVVAPVGEGDISKINVGDAAKIRGIGFAGRSYSGTVSKVHPVAKRTLAGSGNTASVDVEIQLNNPDANIKPGFSAKVEIIGGNSYSMVTVPYEAVRQDENNNEYVYTYEGGKLKKTVIVTGVEMINEVEILDGLSAESIVIYNPDDVDREGAMIHIKGKADVD